MTNFDDHTTQTLVKMCRQLYPHDFLGDMYYAKVVEVLDEQAGADETYKEKIVDGVKGLDDVFKIEFVELSNGYQVQALEAIEGSDFFESVRKDTVKHLYNNPLVWRYFGYEGALGPSRRLHQPRLRRHLLDTGRGLARGADAGFRVRRLCCLGVRLGGAGACAGGRSRTRAVRRFLVERELR